MFTTNLSSDNASHSDKPLIELINEIRNGVLHLLRPDQPTRPTTGDRLLGLQTLKTAADATLKLAETKRVRAETQYKLVELENSRAERKCC